MTEGVRQKHRAEQIVLIKSTARSLLSRHGVSGLSLREVAREMGQTSSALYRYFPTRDDLLTALILDAYNDLGTAVERADARVDRAATRQRFLATGRAIRRWALRHPHEYALIFGTPVPGYVAPEQTIEAAVRVTRVLGSIVAESKISVGDIALAPSWRSMLWWESVESVMGPASPDVVVKSLRAWAEIFGCISFELFGHFVGSVRQDDRFFDTVLEQLADSFDLP